MGTQSFPHHLKGRQALPANVEATEAVQDDNILGTDIDFATDRAAEVAAERGVTAEDLEGLTGTGKDGAITVADVKNWSKEPDA
jgi:pyruvate/2-oxoglutarate dehydrogenase complex dihydrolipoamide acyltransferase (E2) component